MPSRKKKKAKIREVPEHKFKYITGKWLKESVDWLVERQCGCCHSKVWADREGREYDVCVGWHDGCDPDDEELIHSENDPECCVAWKIGFQDPGNAMQCDFDIDWPMPWDPETGDVHDTCTAMVRPRNDAMYESYADEINEAAYMVIRDDQYSKEKLDARA